MLLHGNRSPEDIPFRDELDGLADQHAGVRVHCTVDVPPGDAPWTGRTGPIDAAWIEEVARGLGDPTFHLCGPPGMVVDSARTGSP